MSQTARSEQQDDPSNRSTTDEKDEKPAGGQLATESLKKCSNCGKKETTIHCVHCGQLVCRSCRGEHIRELMKDLKAFKEELETKYPKAVRERMAKINKVDKDLEEKKKKAERETAEAFRDLRKMVDEAEKQTIAKIRQGYKYKKNELDTELKIYEDHLKENHQALDRVANNSCSTIHFAVGRVDDGDVASLCQTRKMYADIINSLHKPEEREEPVRSCLKVKFDPNPTKDGLDKYAHVKTDKEGGKKKDKTDNESPADDDQHQEEDGASNKETTSQTRLS